VKPVRKKQSPKKTKKQALKTPAEQVMSLIKKRTKKGILLSEISSSLGISDKEVRLIVKELMDKNKVERVQKKYYWIEDV
jgi:Mn-dependent DtxR family transcriptional regulator